MIEELIRRNRSYRRFKRDRPLDIGTLRRFVELARLSPSAANMQPLKFLLSADPETNALVFPSIKWAGYLTGWEGPVEEERPAGYIVILGDTTIKQGFGCDHGIAAQSILLGAVEAGFGGCIIGSLDRKRVRGDLAIPERFEILLVIALGEPAETVMIEETTTETGIRYWRDADGVHHVPKRPLDEIIMERSVQ